MGTGPELELSAEPEPDSGEESGPARRRAPLAEATSLDELVEAAIRDRHKLGTEIRSYPLGAEDEPALVFRP